MRPSARAMSSRCSSRARPKPRPLWAGSTAGHPALVGVVHGGQEQEAGADQLPVVVAAHHDFALARVGHPEDRRHLLPGPVRHVLAADQRGARVDVVDGAQGDVVVHVDRSDLHDHEARPCRAVLAPNCPRSPRTQRRVVDGVGAHRPRGRLCGLEPDGDDAPARAPDPAAAHRVVHHVLPGRPRGRTPGAAAAVACVVGASESSVSPKRSSWIQSARPETPTPRSRTPPEVSRSASSPRARRATVAVLSVGSGRVEERLSVVKSWRRTLIVTVRPERPCLRSRVATSPAWRVEQPLHQLAVGEVGLVGAFDAHRLGLALGDDRPVVLGARQLVQPGAVGAADQPHQLVETDALELGHGVDAGSAQALGRGRADPGDDRDVHRPQQLLLGARRHHDQPVGLVEVAGHLGDELRRAEADRGRQPARDLGDPGRGALGVRRHGGTSRSGRSALRGRRRPRRARAARPAATRSAGAS